MSKVLKPCESIGSIVVFNDKVTNVYTAARTLAGRYRLPLRRIYSLCFKGFATVIPPAMMAAVKANIDVDSVYDDYVVEACAVQPTWGVQRIGVVENLDYKANTNNDFSVCNAFVLDTGVYQHPDLNIVQNVSFVPSISAIDVNGHGTAVAGVIGARVNTTAVMGVCPNAKIYNYKVLNDDGTGSFSSVLAALEVVWGWRSSNPQEAKVVVCMAFTAFVGKADYTLLDTVIAKLIDQAAITCVVAAGNQGIDATLCSPAHVSTAICCASYDSTYAMSDFSNYGSLISFQAPGESILTTYNKRDQYAFVSGTSMASAFVAGAVLLYLYHYGSTQQNTPVYVKNGMQNNSLYNVANPAITVPATKPNTTTTSILVSNFAGYSGS